jgi:hypothetical protein
MGSALGHLVNLKPFIDGALEAGHAVSLAAKELHNVNTVLPGRDVDLFQAPYLARPVSRPYPRTLSYPQLVLQRFESGEELGLLTRAWDSIFSAVNPDIVVYDFAYSALVASYGKPWRKWLVGNGFMMPRMDGEFFGVFPGVPANEENVRQIQGAEQRLVAIINAVLSMRGIQEIGSASDILGQAECQLLLTLPELDQFGARPSGVYLGLPAFHGGITPSWPEHGKFRVFAYLSKFGLLDEIVESLVNHDAALLVYCRDDVESLREKFPTVRFVSDPVDLALVNQQADLVVSMANHGTCAISYLYGVPQLMIPRKQEQYYLAARIAQQGRGVILMQDDPGYAGKVESAVAMARKGKFSINQSKIDELSGSRLARFIDKQLRFGASSI